MTAGPRRARDRGHLLVEAMVGCAIVGIALTSVLGAGDAFSRDINRAGVDARAMMLARERLDVLRAAPRSSTLWNVGTDSGTYPSPVETPPWTWQVDVTEPGDSLVAGPVAPPLVYRQAVVRVSYRGRTVQLEAYKW